MPPPNALTLQWFNVSDTNVGGEIATMYLVPDDQKMTSFTPKFKQEAASLVLDQGYTIAYTWRDHQWRYLAAVLDLHARHAVGWAMSTSR